MEHILKKLADWIIEHEKKEALDCKIPDEIIEEWYDIVQERKRRMEENGGINSEQYEMLSDIEKKLQEIKSLREQKCHIPNKKNR